jgi:nitroimidazol reductase NimA-like FMN-containing flavoprotein (pyridoxamine 5'-phosphate oxidase superfamily)
MIDKAATILRDNRLMSLATTRADGWPHCSMVGFAEDGLDLYFVVSRHSQKLANIERDNRVAIVIGRDVIDPRSIRGLSIAARAEEVDDPAQRRRAVLRQLEPPAPEHSAVMVARSQVVTILDYSVSFGHTETWTIDEDGKAKPAEGTPNDWGYGGELKPLH